MTGRLKEADERTKRELADKCQENGWLRRGGYPWQDDPYLEEYPYEFAKAGSVEELRGFFAHGNWALRQGIVYEDLAFVQQVDGGDEWIVYTDPSDLMSVNKGLEEQGIETKGAELVLLPTNPTEISVEDAKKVQRLIDRLEELDDVQNVYTTMDITDEIAEALDAE